MSLLVAHQEKACLKPQLGIFNGQHVTVDSDLLPERRDERECKQMCSACKLLCSLNLHALHWRLVTVYGAETAIEKF